AALLIEADAPRILERVNDFCGRTVAGRVSIVRAAARAAPAKETGARSREGVSPSSLRKLDAGLEGVTDPALKTALQRLGREVAREERRTDRNPPESEPNR
ncbi:MAG: hypothetical protein MI723_11150, partial [Caulobacterales bacterium]|nr:hypothetical protein [Caulobacterales bacterium]